MNSLQSVDQGMKLLSQGHIQQAAQISAALLREASNLAQVHYLACEVAVEQGQFAPALDHIIRAIEIDKLEPVLQFRKAEIEIICRQRLQAQETASSAAENVSDNPSVQMDAARIFAQCDNHLGAEKFLLNAREMKFKTPEFLYEFAKNQSFLGKTLNAEEAISDYLELGFPVNGQILLLRSRLQKQTQDSNHVAMLRDQLARQLPEKERIFCYYALAKELEDLGEYAQSFKALESGSAIKRRGLRFNLADELKNIEDLIKTFQRANFACIPDSTRRDAPIFIVGMPRTGTTLVERIVSQHEDVRSAGESLDFPLSLSAVINRYIAANPDNNLNPMSAALEVNYAEMADHYLNSMEGTLGKFSRCLDKFPFNFLYCGLIRKAFPQARIIHMVRDPMDTCYAVYQTLFNQVCNFSYDLDEIAGYYIAYRRLMDHWHHLMPDAILDVHYETLVSNPIDESKRIADYVGIDWTEDLIEVQNAAEACSTASAAQVREPIHTGSIQKWRHFETELEPLRQKLLAANLINAVA